VGYESLLERAHLTLLDFDPGVVAVAAQPFVLALRRSCCRPARRSTG
jgi:hypothetical protein